MARTIYLQLMLAVLSPVLGDIGIKFKRHPQPVAAPVGDEVAFDCMVNVPGDKLTWRWRPVEEVRWRDVNGTTDKTSARLAVTVMEDTPTSLYQCVAWYGGVSLVSLPARLSVARVDLTNIRPNTRVMSSPPHNTVVLHCKEPASEPPAVITWWKDDKGSKKLLETPHGVLVLHNVTSDDSGVYGCSATNEPSGRTVDLPERIHLKIQHADSREVKFLESEEYVGTIDNEGVLTVSVKPREVLRLWCGVVGSPPPRVSWSRERTGQLGRHGHLLTIDPFSQEDEDVYSCSANGVRRSWKVIALQAPYWEGTARTSANASEGGEVRVACGVPHGQPSPSVYWLLNSEPVYSSKRNSTVDTELFIRPVEKRHAGVVQCFACNALGCAYDAAMLTVLPLQISEDMDYSGEAPKSAHGALQAPKRHSRKNPRKHKAVMVPPSRPNVTRLSDTSVMVSWSQPNHGLSVTFFKVQYKEVSNVSDSSWQTGNWDIQPHIHACEVDTLHPAYYKFRIAAVYSNQDNKQGRSSGRFLLQRRVAQVPRAPDLTLAKALSPKAIQLNWTWSAGDGVQAEGFYIYYRALSSAGLYDKVAVPGGHIRGHVLSNLHPDTAYEAKIRSYTTQAASDFSSIKQAKTHRPANATSTTTEPPVEDIKGSARAPDPLVTAGGALGAVALLVILAVTLLLCRRAKRPPADKEKGTVPEGGGGNGYIQAKVPITITANPMHAEGGDGGVEMSFLHNNNCGNTGNNDDTLPHSRKNGPGNRQYV